MDMFGGLTPENFRRLSIHDYEALARHYEKRREAQEKAVRGMRSPVRRSQRRRRGR